MSDSDSGAEPAGEGAGGENTSGNQVSICGGVLIESPGEPGYIPDNTPPCPPSPCSGAQTRGADSRGEPGSPAANHRRERLPPPATTQRRQRLLLRRLLLRRQQRCGARSRATAQQAERCGGDRHDPRRPRRACIVHFIHAGRGDGEEGGRRERGRSQESASRRRRWARERQGRCGQRRERGGGADACCPEGRRGARGGR